MLGLREGVPFMSVGTLPDVPSVLVGDLPTLVPSSIPRPRWDGPFLPALDLRVGFSFAPLSHVLTVAMNEEPALPRAPLFSLPLGAFDKVLNESWDADGTAASFFSDAGVTTVSVDADAG